MLRKAGHLHNFELRARDGVLGKVKDFYFDDYHWTIRYLVVETGSWLGSRKVLLATSAVGVASWEDSLLSVDLTQDQVRHSPGIDTEQPVSREQETGLHQYYGWPAYWLGAGYYGGLFTPVPEAGPAGPPFMVGLPATDLPRRRTAPDGDPRLRSARTVTGYHIEATDGPIGHVEDYLFDDATWDIRHIVVDTRNWLPGRKVVISPDRISEVNWTQSRVYVDLDRDRIKHAPEYDPHQTSYDDYAARLGAYHEDHSPAGRH